jgi:Spy/CpxP family protein refolding chaperone
MMMRHAGKGLAFLLLASTMASAQDPQRQGRGRRGAQAADSQRGGRGMVNARQAIERLIRAQVQPTGDQMVKLRQIDQRFLPRRVELDREEQQVRVDLRQAMVDSNVNQARIGQLLDRMIAFPGRRATLMEEEQKALAEVLTPLQRARYHAIQEQLRRRIEQGRGGAPPRKPPAARK